MIPVLFVKALSSIAASITKESAEYRISGDGVGDVIVDDAIVDDMIVEELVDE
jgi:hypothetical protein